MRIFRVSLLLLFFVIVYALIRIYTGYREFDEEGMVLWYFEDWELFKIVWKDALEFIWWLLPTYWVYGFALGVVSIATLLLFTRKSRNKMKKRLQSISSATKEDL
jgi:hypothetical protein